MQPLQGKLSLFYQITIEFDHEMPQSQTNLIRESPPQFENRIMARAVYVRSITRSALYQKAPC